MLSSTLAQLRCPASASENDERCCGAELTLKGAAQSQGAESASDVAREIRTGTLVCSSCSAGFPILAGVAIVVPDVTSYILNHVKGISKLVEDRDIPDEILEDYLEAKAEIEVEHIEEDLEADRVVALYVMNHYLRVGDAKSIDWLKPEGGTVSPLIERLIREYWDHGPFSQITEWVSDSSGSKKPGSVIELGAGVGGLYPALKSVIGSYLGVDSSFASVAVARHLALGAPYSKEIRIPADLLQGPVSRKPLLEIPKFSPETAQADFVVGELEALPVMAGAFDLSIALNAIDMMPEPRRLPQAQSGLLKKGGHVIQSCPYIWHEEVARGLRESLPKDVRDSANAVESLYTEAGFTIEKTAPHVPWLFFKHLRQLEIYSVHAFLGVKKA